MTIRSYAQNFEDVLLYRALHEVEKGSYIDVGAGHPDLHSVTKLFYELGWSGINVEPVPAFARALSERRPRDINLNAAVSPAATSATEFVIVHGWEELSTTDQARTAELRAEGRELSPLVVPVVRLDDAVDAWGPEDIHFLKVDVEGGELDVLTTLDLTKVRPWIVVVEVVSASSAADRRSDIHAHLEGNDYRAVYFDGLNEFYVAHEHAERLTPSFAEPVSVRDDFVTDSGAAATIDVLAGILGMAAPANPAELQQRLEILLADRIRFEVEAREAEARSTDPVVDDLREENGALLLRVRRCEEEVAALEQALFERDRLIAAHTAALARVRASYAGEVEPLRAKVVGLEMQITDLLSSTSWRLTRPLRALRRGAARGRAAR